MLGTANLLDVVRRTPSVRAIVVVTSDKCYENSGLPVAVPGKRRPRRRRPLQREQGVLGDHHVRLSPHVLRGGQPAVATARAGNVIGGGDWSRDRLIPDIVRALTQSTDPRLRFPGATRPWQHVLDAVHGYVTLAEHLLAHGQQYADGWNFGPSDESGCTVLDLAERFLTAWGSSRSVVVESRVAPNESLALRLDSTRARQALGWSPRLNLDEAIQRTAAWYHAWSDDQHGVTLTEAQIEQFLRAAERADSASPQPVLNAV